MNFKLVIIAGVLATAVLAGAQGAKAGGQGGPGGPRGFGGPGQGGPGGGQRRMMSVDDRIKRMTTDLKLTPAQQKKLKPILEAQMKKGKELFENKKLTDQQKKDAFGKMRDENRKKVEAIFTPEQKKKYEEMRKQRMNRGGGPGGPGGPGRGGPAGAPPKGKGH